MSPGHEAHDIVAPVARGVRQIPGLQNLVECAGGWRPYRGLDDLDYPSHDWTATVTTCGRICYK